MQLSASSGPHLGASGPAKGSMRVLNPETPIFLNSGIVKEYTLKLLRVPSRI